MGSFVPRGYSIMELQHARPIRQRPEDDVRYCECCEKTRLARDNMTRRCSPCTLKYGDSELTPAGWLLQYGERVHPTYPPEALSALIGKHFGSYSAVERVLDWAPKLVANWTRRDRSKTSHALIPQWRCDALNQAIEEIERR